MARLLKAQILRNRVPCVSFMEGRLPHQSVDSPIVRSTTVRHTAFMVNAQHIESLDEPQLRALVQTLAARIDQADEA